jgi:hypothetical protein
MKSAVFLLPMLLSAAAPALAHDHDGNSTFTWCVAEGTDARGKVRYFSEPFEGPTDQWIELSFQQYLEQHFLKKDHGFVVTCKTSDGLAEARAALNTAKAPAKDVMVIPTGWRDHFE